MDERTERAILELADAIRGFNAVRYQQEAMASHEFDFPYEEEARFPAHRYLVVVHEQDMAYQLKVAGALNSFNQMSLTPKELRRDFLLEE